MRRKFPVSFLKSVWRKDHGRRIKRQDDRRSAPYWQVFHFRGEGRITVAAILEKLNERDQLEDIKGKQCRKIRWECGCMQKMCGGCAMVINGHPALACGVRIMRR